MQEKKALEQIIEQYRIENKKTCSIFEEKDSEIDFLQKEIGSLMNEKSEKENIIKSKLH